MIRRVLRFLLRLYYFHYFMGLSGMFLISAFLLLAHPPLVFVLLTNRAPGPNDSFLLLNLLVEIALLVPGIVGGVASWIVWRELRSDGVQGRRWVIIASLLNLLMFLGLSILFRHEKGANVFWAVLAVGLVGLIAFSRAGGPLWGRGQQLQGP
jgi:hypothetical protein